MAKRKQAQQLKVTVIYTSTGDWNNRIQKVLELLLQRPLVQGCVNKQKPPTDGSNGSPVSGGNGRDDPL